MRPDVDPAIKSRDERLGGGLCYPLHWGTIKTAPYPFVPAKAGIHIIGQWASYGSRTPYGFRDERLGVWQHTLSHGEREG